jgi:hypothetical protein
LAPHAENSQAESFWGLPGEEKAVPVKKYLNCKRYPLKIQLLVINIYFHLIIPFLRGFRIE